MFEFEDRSEPTKNYKPELFCLKFFNGSSEGRQIEIRKSGGGSTYCIDGKNLDALEVREEIPQSKGKHKLKISFQNEILSVELNDKYMARGTINGGKPFMPTKLEISYDTADYSHSLRVIEQAEEGIEFEGLFRDDFTSSLLDRTKWTTFRGPNMNRSNDNKANAPRIIVPEGQNIIIKEVTPKKQTVVQKGNPDVQVKDGSVAFQYRSGIATKIAMPESYELKARVKYHNPGDVITFCLRSSGKIAEHGARDGVHLHIWNKDLLMIDSKGDSRTEKPGGLTAKEWHDIRIVDDGKNISLFIGEKSDPELIHNYANFRLNHQAGNKICIHNREAPWGTRAEISSIEIMEIPKQPQSSSALFPNNLVAFFPFKDKSDQARLKKSEHINDLSGKKNDLAIHCDDIVSKGDGLLIDNLAQGQEASSALIKEIKTDVSDKASVSCWIKVEEKAQFRPLKLGRAGDSVHSVLMLYFKPGPNVPNQQGVEIILLGNKDSSIRTPYKTYNIRIGEWHHYVIVDNAEKVQLYIDGSLFNEIQIDDADKQLNLDYPYLTLGCNPFKGAIREVAVYDIALNPEQVKALYGSIR